MALLKWLRFRRAERKRNKRPVQDARSHIEIERLQPNYTHPQQEGQWKKNHPSFFADPADCKPDRGYRAEDWAESRAEAFCSGKPRHPKPLFADSTVVAIVCAVAATTAVIFAPPAIAISASAAACALAIASVARSGARVVESNARVVESNARVVESNHRIEAFTRTLEATERANARALPWYPQVADRNYS
ncbi:hypothetical protein MMC07_000586 [Pseudocyphellaria aurata]|nr:hypothetical protein [Pseudocyphellaria aurata]